MRYWIWICLLLTVSCGQKPAPVTPDPEPQKPKADPEKIAQKIREGESLVQSGDLVLRTGNDMTSLFFKQLNLSDKTYSHCGLAVKEGDTVYVYHALGGELNPDQKIRKEPLQSFILPAENEGFGIYRFGLSDTDKKSIIYTADSLYRKGIPFDIDFDLSTNHRMYCAEYIYKSIRWGTRGRVQIPLTVLKGKTGVATDNLFINGYAREIRRTVYE